MKKYKNNPIITIDDDIIYDNNLIELLLNGYYKFPNCVLANRVHKIKYGIDNKPIEYNKWYYQYKNEKMIPSYDLFATGVGGVLYPPNILKIDNIKIEDINKSYFADDIFLKWWENQLKIQIVYTGNGKNLNGHELQNQIVNKSGLALINNLQNRNDVYIKNLNLCNPLKHNKKVIYTCITGSYEKIIDPTYVQSDFDYICFTDNPNQTSKVWKFREIPKELQKYSKVKQQRLIKICPHKYLSEYVESLWVDGAIDILSDVNKFIDMYCNIKDKSVYIRRHPARSCIYVEANTCISMKKDTSMNINSQIKKYKEENFPVNFGLVETGYIYRKHNDPYCIKLMDLWANELINGSHRDQLSFNYVLWKVGDNGFQYLDTKLLNNEYFKWYPKHNRK